MASLAGCSELSEIGTEGFLSSSGIEIVARDSASKLAGGGQLGAA